MNCWCLSPSSQLSCSACCRVRSSIYICVSLRFGCCTSGIACPVSAVVQHLVSMSLASFECPTISSLRASTMSRHVGFATVSSQTFSISRSPSAGSIGEPILSSVATSTSSTKPILYHFVEAFKTAFSTERRSLILSSIPDGGIEEIAIVCLWNSMTLSNSETLHMLWQFSLVVSYPLAGHPCPSPHHTTTELHFMKEHSCSSIPPYKLHLNFVVYRAECPLAAQYTLAWLWLSASNVAV